MKTYLTTKKYSILLYQVYWWFFIKSNIYDQQGNLIEAEDIADYGDLGYSSDSDPLYSNVCYDLNNPPVLKAGPERKYCGRKPKYVAADGATRLLLRVRSGMPGKACFKAVPDPEGKDIGRTDPTNSGAIISDTQFNSPYYTFGTYIAPDKFDSLTDATRTVKLEIAFAPNPPNLVGKRTTTLAIRKDIEIKRPPILLVHGFGDTPTEDGTSFQEQFREPEEPMENWIIGDMDYTNHSIEDLETIVRQRLVADSFKRILKRAHDQGIAATQVDVLAHSYGGLVVRTFEKAATLYFLYPEKYRVTNNFNQGYIHRMITFGTPHYGSQMANLLIHLRDKNQEVLWKLRNFVYPGRALCDLAENSPALARLGESSIPSTAAIGNARSPGNWGWIGIADSLSFLVGDVIPSEDWDTDIQPYVFKEQNDNVVTVTSQAGGFATAPPPQPYTKLFSLNHNAAFPFGITESQEVADWTFEKLHMSSRSEFSNFSSPSSTGDGDTRDYTVGINHTTQKQEYIDRCGPMGDMDFDPSFILSKQQ
jgi:pimeloyl-ACP methyl ester carboxylesterase